MTRYLAILCCTLWLLPGTGLAQSVSIIGDSDCARWSEDPAAAKASWLLGYLSGMNTVWSGEGKTPHNPLSQFSTAAQAFKWMDGYCKLNPGKKVSEGASALFFDMASKKR